MIDLSAICFCIWPRQKWLTSLSIWFNQKVSIIQTERQRAYPIKKVALYYVALKEILFRKLTPDHSDSLEGDFKQDNFPGDI